MDAFFGFRRYLAAIQTWSEQVTTILKMLELSLESCSDLNPILDELLNDVHGCRSARCQR